jgi:hypothetical protein
MSNPHVSDQFKEFYKFFYRVEIKLVTDIWAMII